MEDEGILRKTMRAPPPRSANEIPRIPPDLDNVFFGPPFGMVRILRRGWRGENAEPSGWTTRPQVHNVQWGVHWGACPLVHKNIFKPNPKPERLLFALPAA